MEISEEYSVDATIVDVKGRIDSTTAQALGDKLTSLIEAGRTRLVIDLNQVDYISSAGFRVLLVSSRLAEESHGKLALCSLAPGVQKLFELTAFTDLFEIYTSRPKATTA
jgi:anti-sigma B factor antagonist